MKSRLKRKRGQGLIEYIALTALVAIVSIGTVKVFGGKLKTRLNQVTNTFDRNIQQGLKAQLEIDPEAPAGGAHRKSSGGFRIPGLDKLPSEIFGRNIAERDDG